MGEPIFLHYDRSALDREYDNSGKVPDAARYLPRWVEESARVRQELAARLDLPYGPAPSETLDVFLPPPAAPHPAPIQLFLHGGYWRSRDKGDFDFVARGLHRAGAAVVVVNYALMPAVDMDEVVRQCRAAVAWTHVNAGTFGGDPRRLFVSGHSAGGHLTAMCLATDWRAFGGLPPDTIKGGCGISGLYDLEPIRLCYLNDTLQLTEAAARRNSPVHLTPARPARLLLPLGGLEGPEYHRQSERLAVAWRRTGSAVTVHDLPGEDHFSIVDQLLDETSPLSRLVLGQMGLV